MQKSLKISLLRLALVNLIPVIGVIFFEWELFEIGVTYVLETFAIYTVYEIDHFFIDKRTRLPFVFAFIQLVFALVTVAAIMLASVLIIYIMITPEVSTPQAFSNQFVLRLKNLNMLYPLITLLVVEFGTYYIRKSKDSAHIPNSTWRVIRRMLYSHLYISLSLMFLFFFPQSLVLFIPFFIGLKIVLEYSTEDERVFKALWTWILKTRLGRWFKEYTKPKIHPKGYLSKKPTYSRRNKRK